MEEMSFLTFVFEDQEVAGEELPKKERSPFYRRPYTNQIPLTIKPYPTAKLQILRQLKKRWA
jgi:hypothetical protein